jgi:hypothetical protein
MTSTGVSADFNFCVQVCLTNGFVELVRAHERVSAWFDIGRDTSAATMRSIQIKTPFEAGTRNETHAPPEPRTSNHDEDNDESESGSGSDGESQRNALKKRRGLPVEQDGHDDDDDSHGHCV